MSKATLEQIKKLFDDENISYKHLTHDTIPRDSKGASLLRGTTHEHGAKAIVLQTKSGAFFQAVVPAHQRISLKKLKKILGEKNVSLAHPQEVLSLSDCVVGSVPPFGSLWNIRVFVDRSLLDIDQVIFSAGTLEDSILVSPQALVEINRAEVVDILKED
ncbi:MAG: hypothetical protein KC535_00420 [Nanoarchaeota archaeon]|nr:hypothetical protein [Nanoarchaeota archaeon]